jgi:hypothetical protein
MIARGRMGANESVLLENKEITALTSISFNLSGSRERVKIAQQV